MRLLLPVAAALFMTTSGYAAEPSTPSPASSPPEPAANAPPTASFEFRGHKAGEELAVAYPKNRGILSPCRSEYPGRVLVYCYDKGSGFGGAIDGFIQNVPVSSLKYFYYEDKLVTVEMLFDAKDYEQIVQMLVGRYGAVTGQDTQVVQTTLGVQYANRMAYWQFAEGKLQVNERHELATQSKLMFSDTAGFARMKAASDKMQESAGRSAF